MNSFRFAQHRGKHTRTSSHSDSVIENSLNKYLPMRKWKNGSRSWKWSVVCLMLRRNLLTHIEMNYFRKGKTAGLFQNLIFFVPF